MSGQRHFEYEEEKRGFLQRYGFVIGVGVVAVLGVFLISKTFSGGHKGPARREQEMVMIKPANLPPPPPPPPPPPQQNEPKQQMMEQTPVDENEAKPEEAPAPSADLGTSITGNGPADSFGLSANRGGMNIGGGGGHHGGSKFGWYANAVNKAISDALGRNALTRVASFNVKVRIWSDTTGRITRSKLAGTTGDPAVDDAIKNGVLNGFQLPEPPPDGMPMPIVMRLSARRPN